MEHEIYSVTDFQIVAPYTLRVWFDDGTDQTINFEPILHGRLFGPLRGLKHVLSGQDRSRVRDACMAQ